MRWVLGDRLSNSQLGEQNFNVFRGMAILSSDAISSVAYAVEEMLWILVPIIGLASYLWMPRVAGAILLLMLILIFSYRQTVEAYPNGGGAYIVAKENMGTIYGLIAGASLSVGYIVTVAVSICAGTAAVTSALPVLYPHRVLIAVVIIVLLVIGNMRGIRESAQIFSIPTYAFIAAMLALIVAGLLKYFSGNYTPTAAPAVAHVSFGTGVVSVFLLLRAFSSGCSALTGVEAISNAVPNFTPPSQKNAKAAYLLLATAVLVTFGGVAYLVRIYHAVPDPQLTVIAQLTIDVFGKGFMFYFIQVATMLILAMAANTAFAGFPTLLSVIAQDGYVPRQLALRGHRLNYSNGIIFLAMMAIILVLLFQGDTHLLIPLYAVGVFTSFTLSQSGMLLHWLRLKPKAWHHKALINGLGALTTLIAVIIIGATKFQEGAWIVVAVIPILVTIMLKINNHYTSVAKQLNVPSEAISRINLSFACSHHVVVPIDSLNVMVLRALRYARSMSSHVIAFHVEPYDGEADKLRAKWAMLKTDIPLIIKQSPYREVVDPLVKYIDSEEHESTPGDVITILLPQFLVSKLWQMALHNNTSIFIANALFRKRNVVVAVLPFYLDDISRWKKKQALRHKTGPLEDDNAEDLSTKESPPEHPE